jgi:putative DNA primase/helicase
VVAVLSRVDAHAAFQEVVPTVWLFVRRRVMADDRMKGYKDLYPDGQDGSAAAAGNVIALDDKTIADVKAKRASKKNAEKRLMPDGARELPPPSEPMAVARTFIDHGRRHGGELTLRHWRGGWWEWRTSRWVELDERAVRKDAYAFTENAMYEDPNKGATPWAPNRHRIADLLDALAALCHLREDMPTPGWSARVDAPPAREFVSVANGLLHVETRTLRPHDPRLFNLSAVPFDYDPAAPAPARWTRFLEELWPDDLDARDALQEFVGYVISGRTDLHKILLLVGPTRAGKGVFARVLKSLVGEGNYCGPTLASLGTNFGLAPLIGKPLAIVSDARLGGANTHQVVERLLSISGEDMLTVDRKFRDQWNGALPTRFLIISNELPRFGDSSGAIAGRFVVLMLTKSFLGKENTALTAELLPELPGILNWALTGLARLEQNKRFTEPASAVDAVVALQDLVSPVAAFVRDKCVRGTFEVPCTVLYESWKTWAEDNGHRAGSAQTFGRDLRAVVPGVRVVRPRDGQRARALLRRSSYRYLNRQ